MARCSVCQHNRVAEINAALLSPGVSIRAVAGQFSVSRSTIARHAQNHLASAVATPAPTGAPVTLPPALPSLPTTATVREHLARNIRQLDLLADAAFRQGEAVAFAGLIRTKVFTLEKSGMLSDLDGNLPTSPTPPTEAVDEGLAWLQDSLRFVVTGEMKARAEMVLNALDRANDEREILHPVAQLPIRVRTHARTRPVH